MVPGESEPDSGTRSGRSRPRSILILVVVVLILFNAGYSIHHEWNRVKPLDRFAGRPWPEYGMETFAPLAGRYLQLRPDLAGVAQVGLVFGFSDYNHAHRMMAQSMLAPTLVRTDDTPALVIASFKSDQDLDRWLASVRPGAGRWVARRRLGEGLALLEHSAP